MKVQRGGHFQVLHGRPGRAEINFWIHWISKPIIPYTPQNSHWWLGGGLVSHSIILSSLKFSSSSWVRNCYVLTVQTPGLTSKWWGGGVAGGLTLRHHRSSVTGAGKSPRRLNGLEQRGIQEVSLEQNHSQDCREPISHNLTFHSILVSEGEALWSQPKVEEPHKFWLAACFFLLHSLRVNLLLSVFSHIPLPANSWIKGWLLVSKLEQWLYNSGTWQHFCFFFCT